MGDIIPGVEEKDFQKNNYLFYCIWQNDIPIGFLSLYLEYQQKNTAYLSVLYIKEANRKSGIGVEIIEALVSELKVVQYNTIRTHCSLRNTMALRFWVKNGFDKILDVECDGNLFPENFGGIELMKTI
jgi:GNAT superfamily N-acetyltransferase